MCGEGAVILISARASMSQQKLADLFELMHSAPESFRTLRAVIRTTSNYEPLRRAQAREFEGGRLALTGCPMDPHD